MPSDPFWDFQQACRALLAAQVEVPDEAVMSLPPRREFGDLSSNVAFLLAKPMRRAPRQIAQEIVAKMDTSSQPLVDNVEVAGAGYINFFLDYSAFASHVLDAVRVEGERYGALAAAKPLRVIVEHTSVNPNKEWHIGHARNCALGDVVARLYRAAGHHVDVQNYIDDTGKQATDSLFAMQYFGVTAPEDVKLDHFVGEQYVRLHSILGREQDVRAQLEALGSRDGETSASRGALEAELGEIEAIKSGIERLMHDVERGDYVEEVSRLLNAQLETAWSLGVFYDQLSWEGDIVRSGLFQEAMAKIEQSPFVYKADSGPKAGCWVINMTDFWEGGKASDDDVLEKVLVRSNGIPTYEGKDIAYQMWKFGLLERSLHYKLYAMQPNGQPLYSTWWEGTEREHPKVDRVINVIDSRQSYAQAAVYTALRVTGHEEAYRNSYHLAYGVVYLPSGHMSGRKGIGISADEVLAATKEEAYRRTVAKRGEELDAAEMERIAEAIARSSIRYSMVQYNPLKEILFDIDQALSLDGNTASYLQYAVVRTESLGRRAVSDEGLDVEAIWQSAAHLSFADMVDEERDLVSAVARFPGVFGRALENLAPHLLTDYAFELAGLFTQFYHKCPVLKAETANQVHRRLALSRAVNQVLTNIFQLLGLDKLEAM